MAPEVLYRTHRHRKEILATRARNRKELHDGVDIITNCSSCRLHNTQNDIHFKESCFCKLFTDNIIYRATMFTKWTLLVCILLQVISMRRCNGQSVCIPSCVCMWKGGKQTVECLDNNLNRLTSIPASLSPDTQVLDMTGNNIQVLEDGQFVKVNLLNLQKLFLLRCGLRRIEVEAFIKLQNLVVLDLSYNVLTAVPSGAFRYPISLRRLNLNGNPITKLEAGSFSFLKSLTELELRNCQIEVISDRAFRGLESLQFLKLDGNSVKTIRGIALLPTKSIRAIDLHENPWSCDCHLQTLIEVMRQKNVHVNVPPICMGPPRLYKKPWDRVSLNSFACEPRVLDSSATYQESIVEGSNITLECHVTGDPDPSIIWVHRGKQLTNRTEIGSSGEFYSISEFGNIDKTGSLFIPYLRLQDSGRYACIAENIAGKAFRNFTLLILSHTVEVETIVNNNKPPANKVEEAPPKGIIIAIGLGIALLVMLISILLFTCCRKQRRARNHGKTNRQTNTNTMYKHSNSANHVGSVTTEASMVCDEHDITLLDVIKTKPLPRLGPYECIPTTDIDTFDMIPNKELMTSGSPAYVVQPGAQQNAPHTMDMWREYQQISGPGNSDRSPPGPPIGLGVSYQRSDAPHHSNENDGLSASFDSVQMRLQSELTDTIRRKGEKNRMIPVSIPLPPALDQRERGDGSSEQSNTTGEFPECSARHPPDNLAEKRRHRQSWESMVNTNNGCIKEDDWPGQSSQGSRESTGESGLKRGIVVYPRTAGQQPLPMQPRITSPKSLTGQPDCIQPLISQNERIRSVKKDTEV